MFAIANDMFDFALIVFTKMSSKIEFSNQFIQFLN